MAFPPASWRVCSVLSLRWRCASRCSPFAFEGATNKIARTAPGDVRGLDQLRLATRHNVQYFVAAKNDVLTELRRLSRASEAMNASFADEAAAVEAEDADDLEA